jgi:hypothetical protein
MFKVERRMTNGVWYEVLLSPFHNEEDVQTYHKKYSPQYPLEERVYRVVHIPSGTLIKQL